MTRITMAGEMHIAARFVGRPLALCLAILLSTAARAQADDAQIAFGRSLVEENCGRCHAIGVTGASPFAPAPPFRDLGERYPIEDLEEALAEGIVSGHPAMPEFTFEPDQIGAIIAYLKSLQ